MRHVAEAAGVSRMTASRAFKEDAPISPKLREKVLTVAERLGYKPDQMVTQLMSSFASQRAIDYRETIAALWWPGRWRVANDDENNYNAKILRGLETSAALHSCKVEHVVMTEDMTPRAINRILTARNIQGVIITPPPSFTRPTPALDWDQFCIVSIGATLHKPRFHRARMSHYHSMVIALEQLQKLGCQRPCLLLNSDLEQRMDRAYTGAFLAWHEDAADRIWRSETLSTRGLKSWIRTHKPDAVLADINRWQGHLPEPYASKRFVTLDVSDRNSEISGVFQNTELLAEYAVDLLMRVRLRKETGIPEFPLTIICDGMWVDGQSLQI